MLASALKDPSFELARPALPEISDVALQVSQTHPTATDSKATAKFECTEEVVEDYEVYATVGLKFLELSLTQAVFKAYPKLLPGAGEVLVNRMISKETLAVIAAAHRLNTPLLMYAQAERAVNIIDDQLLKKELLTARIGAAYMENAESANLKTWIAQTFDSLIKVEYQVLSSEEMAPAGNTAASNPPATAASSTQTALRKNGAQMNAPTAGSAARSARSETIESDVEDGEEPKYNDKTNYVGTLLEYIAKRALPITLAEDYDDFGQDHVKEFHCRLVSTTLGSQGEIGFGAASTKKESKKRAYFSACIAFELLQMDGTPAKKRRF